LLQTFADQAVIAIENARLFNETREALERQTATAEILKIIASSPSDVQPVFDVIVERAVQLCGARMGRVYRYDGNLIHLVGGHGLSVPAREGAQRPFPRPATDDTIVGRVMLSRRPTILADLNEDDTVPPLSRQMIEALGARSQVTMPMLLAGEPIGAITLSWAEPKGYNDHQIALLRTFADQAVIAIENARLFNELQAKTADLQEALQQQTATADVLKVISRSAFDLETVLDALLSSACRLCEADIGTIRYKEGGEFRLAATFGCKPEWIEHFRRYSTKPDRSSVFGRTIVEGHIVHIPDLLADPDYKRPEAQKLMGFKAALGVPLAREGEAFGVINLFRFNVSSFEDRQIELVQTFADQAVIAISNVQLFRQVQERTRELSASLDDLRAAQDRLVQTEKLASLGQLTAGIAHEIKNPLNFVNNFAVLTVELTDELKAVLRSAALGEGIREEIDDLTRTMKDNLEKIVQHGKRADSIVKNMLLHSREGSGERRPAEINAIIDESLNLAYHGARAEKPGFSITLQRDFDPATGMADVYPQEITRVLLNLIANGFYAASRQAAETGDGFEPTLRATTKNLGDQIEIRIRDNGAGIAPEVKEKIFNPFFTTKPAGEGTGLGLSISHDIVVKQHGGTIDVDTAPGIFTEFIIRLPRQ
jgi:signal transduction histidine kinase